MHYIAVTWVSVSCANSLYLALNQIYIALRARSIVDRIFVLVQYNA